MNFYPKMALVSRYMGSCVITLIRYVGVVEFIVRRWPTGGRDNNSDNMHFRPSEASKSLRASMADGPGEESLRYRSLIQELGILLHEVAVDQPLAGAKSRMASRPFACKLYC
jgi:hypothetical protein